MARFSWMRARVENWANWKVRQFDGGGRYASVKLTDPTPAPTDPYADAPIHPNEEDAWAIESALRVVVLASELKATLECHYLSKYTEAEKLRRLHIAKRTLYDRLDRIDGLLVQHFGDKQAAAKQERQRVEALIAKGRPA
jgi:hypothetical protein